MPESSSNVEYQYLSMEMNIYRYIPHESLFVAPLVADPDGQVVHTGGSDPEAEVV